MKIINNIIGDKMELFGQVIVNAIQPFTKSIAEFIKSKEFEEKMKLIRKWIKTNLPIIIQTGIDWFKNIW